MASYVINKQYPGVVFLGGTQTQEVMFIGITINPGVDNLYFEFSIDKPAYAPALVKSTATGFTDVFGLALGITGVDSMEWVQIPKKANLLPAMAITVVSASGNSTDEITVPLGLFTQQYVEAQVGAAVRRLNEVEASAAPAEVVA